MEKSFVYQDTSIEFVTVSAQYCQLCEHSLELDRDEWIHRMLCLLPLLYLKAELCADGEVMGDGEVQHFVTEDDYNAVQSAVLAQLGSDDTYLDVLIDDFRYSDELASASVAENIADIYQELKDLCASYQTAQEEVMNDALIACLEAFREHWGAKIIGAMRALHNLQLDYARQ